MAMKYGLYDTRTMLDAINVMPPSPMFLTNTFFPTRMTVDTELVEVDIVKGNQKLAPFISPVQEGLVIARDGFKSPAMKPPYIKIKRPTIPPDAFMRQAGETVYSTTTPAQRAANMMANDLAEMRAMIDRRIEWMAAQALFYGGVYASHEDAHKEFHIDFGRNANHNIILLGDAALTVESEDVFKLLRHMKRTVSMDSGLTADVCILGSAVVDVFLSNKLVEKRLDITRMNVGNVNVQDRGQGVTYWGYLADPGLDVYSYDVTYTTQEGDVREMVPDDMIFVGASGAGRLMFGAIRDLDGLYATEYFAKQWSEPDPSTAWTMLQSSPLTIPYYPDAFVGAHVLGDGGHRKRKSLIERFADYDFEVENAYIYKAPVGKGDPITNGIIELPSHFSEDLVLGNRWIKATKRTDRRIDKDGGSGGYSKPSDKPGDKKGGGISPNTLTDR